MSGSLLINRVWYAIYRQKVLDIHLDNIKTDYFFTQICFLQWVVVVF